MAEMSWAPAFLKEVGRHIVDAQGKEELEVSRPKVTIASVRLPRQHNIYIYIRHRPGLALGKLIRVGVPCQPKGFGLRVLV
jgi:hypothetical protein